MSDNIISISNGRSIEVEEELTVEELIKGFKDEEFKEVLMIGINKDDKCISYSNINTKAEVVYLLEEVKKSIMN